MPNEPFEPGEQPDPHHVLNNPASDPDPTEWPDPYDKRPDPRDPAPDDEPFGDESHTPTGATSSSEPHPDQDIEAGERARPPQRDKLDD
jgi:hypothetical protein